MLIPRKYQPAAATIFCLVLLYVVGLEASVFPTIDVCEPNPYYAGAKECAPHYIVHIPFIYLAHFLDAGAAVISALATIAIGGFTYTLWRSTDKLWKAGEDQLEATKRAAKAAEKSALVAERTLNDIERPYIFAEITGGTLPDPDTVVLPEINFTLTNYGRTPAVLKRSCDQILVVTELPPEPPYSTIREGEMIIGAGDSKPFTRTITFRGSEIHQIRGGEATLFLFGYVIYEDVFDRIHTKGFGFRFGRNLKSFNVAGGDAYNYSKTEKK